MGFSSAAGALRLRVRVEKSNTFAGAGGVRGGRDLEARHLHPLEALFAVEFFGARGAVAEEHSELVLSWEAARELLVRFDEVEER